MSDFDREAERERLREQFERDEAKRAATERMSELLLKGATMTNKHCDTCGDPIFRHNGQEFCPTCHGGPGAVGAVQEEPTETPQQGEAADVATQPDAAETTPSGGNTADASGQHTDAAAQAHEDATEQMADRTEEPVAAPNDTAHGEPEPTAEPSGRKRQPDPVHGPSGTPEQSGADDLAAAQASLTRSLTALAQRAEATEDVSRAREYLLAAREAAEALAAAERVGR